MIDKFRPRFSSSSHAFNSCEWRKASKKQCPGTNGADGTGTYPADLMNVSCAALSTTLPGKTLSRSSTSLSPSKSAALRLRLLVLVCFGTAAFPLPPLFLILSGTTYLSPGSFVKAFRHTQELRSDRLLLLRMFSFLLIEWVRARVRCRINLTLTSTNPQKVSKLDGRRSPSLFRLTRSRQFPAFRKEGLLGSFVIETSNEKREAIRPRILSEKPESSLKNPAILQVFVYLEEFMQAQQAGRQAGRLQLT